MGWLPRYPVYVPSRGRYEEGHTVKFLIEDGVPFSLVVEPQEYRAYAERYGRQATILTLPKNNGGLIFARNWIRDHATAAGHERHWQLDDNIRYVKRRHNGKRIRCRSGVALRVVEDFADRYENVAIAGLNYSMFQPDSEPTLPFRLNCHVYSCTLFLNSLPYRWRAVYNDDTDMCLQCLAGGWCLVQVNTFTVDKLRTMLVKGGNTHALYQGDGRLRMARALERLWPGVVTVDRRFQRPQHVVNWKRFDTPLRPKPGVDLAALPKVGDYGLELVRAPARPAPPTRTTRARASRPDPRPAP